MSKSKIFTKPLKPGGGGGGGLLPYVCILGMCRARDPHFQPWISVPEHIIFTNYPKSVPEHHHFTFFGGFCRSGDHNFPNFFHFNPFIASHGRFSPNAKHSAAPRVRSRSGDTHFPAQNGSSLFWSPPFSSSKRLKLVPEPHIFTLDREPVPEPLPILPRHIPTKIWGEYPPPPPPRPLNLCFLLFFLQKLVKIFQSQSYFISHKNLTRARLNVFV